MSKITVKILTVLTVISLSGCVAPVVITGLGVASVATNEATGKGIADHAVSTVRDQDCKIARVLQKQNICQDETPEFQFKVTTTGVTPSSVEEIQSKYR
jgi:predicted regulator of amino acid metabolism with ACT domain